MDVNALVKRINEIMAKLTKFVDDLIKKILSKVGK